MPFLKMAIVALLAAEIALAQQQFPGRPHEHTAPIVAEALPAEAGTIGVWTQLPFGSPMNPVHVALLRSGKVLIIAGSGNYPTEKVFMAGVWDPPAGFVRTQAIGTDMFCNGMVMLPDGRAFVVAARRATNAASAGSPARRSSIHRPRHSRPAPPWPMAVGIPPSP